MSHPLDIGGSEAGALPIVVRAPDEVKPWAARQGEVAARWLEVALPAPAPGEWRFVPGEDGPAAVIAVADASAPRAGALAALAQALPAGRYRLGDEASNAEIAASAWQWCAGAYRFTRYREPSREAPVLVLPAAARAAEPDIEATRWVRDLVNTPAGALGPGELVAEVETLARRHGAEVRLVRGDALFAEYPMVAEVGRAAARAPALADLRWGDPTHPKLTLVGKGVIFDSGGLDLKPSQFMRNMKKDMGGAAHALGLAHAVMARKLPVRLRLLIPAVENAVAGDAFRPGDVLRSRKGLTVEIHNTDAEGRLILADPLADAAAEDPDLLLDFATLTGAARVALGPDVPALFSNDDALADALVAACEEAGEALWRMPLHRPYRAMLDSDVADLTNASAKPQAGAITAALFLAEFAGEARSWAHLDVYAWNDSARPGRPPGGEAQGLRGIAAYLSSRFGA
jgi:leucyl aminopeptidase